MSCLITTGGQRVLVSEAAATCPLGREVLCLPAFPVPFREGIPALAKNKSDQYPQMSTNKIYRAMRRVVERALTDTDLETKAAWNAAYLMPDDFMQNWESAGPITRARLWKQCASELNARNFVALHSQLQIVSDFRIARHVFAAALLEQAAADPNFALQLAKNIALRRRAVDQIWRRTQVSRLADSSSVVTADMLLRFRIGADLKVLRCEFASRNSNLERSPLNTRGSSNKYSIVERKRLKFLCRTKLHADGPHAGEPDWKAIHATFTAFSERRITLASLKDFASSRLYPKSINEERRRRNYEIMKIYGTCEERERLRRREFRSTNVQLLKDLGIAVPSDIDAPLSRTERGVAMLLGRGVLPFTPQEDQVLRELLQKFGVTAVSIIAAELNREFANQRAARKPAEIRRRLLRIQNVQSK